MRKTAEVGERLPLPILQALCFTLEECREQAKAAIDSTYKQLSAARGLGIEDRAAALKNATAQMSYWQNVNSAINMILDRAKRKLKWPYIVKAMTVEERIAHNIGDDLWNAMQWKTENEA